MLDDFDHFYSKKNIFRLFRASLELFKIISNTLLLSEFMILVSQNSTQINKTSAVDKRRRAKEMSVML